MERTEWGGKITNDYPLLYISSTYSSPEGDDGGHSGGNSTKGYSQAEWKDDKMRHVLPGT